MPYMSCIYHSKKTIKIILAIIALEFGIMHLAARAGEEPVPSCDAR